jgi:crotonobetainyl-CoA:carnitine CoA-transferase CaiB-like acyl-CoA transferase
MQASRILLFLPLAEMLLGNTAQRRASDYLGGHFPCYDVYETSDSQYMALGALEPFIWSAFCSAIGKEHLVALQFSNNTEELERVREELKQLFKARSRHEWETFFADRDLCCEPVRSLKEVSQSLPAESGDRGPAANEPSHHELFAGMMFSTLGNDLYSRKGAPHMGQHTEEILRELGFSSQEIGSLKSRKLIGTMDEKPVRRYGSIVSG